MHDVWDFFYAQTPINEWEYTVQMIEEGKLEVSDLITHRAGLKDLKQLFNDIHNHSITICKALYSTALNVWCSHENRLILYNSYKTMKEKYSERNGE